MRHVYLACLLANIVCTIGRGPFVDAILMDNIVTRMGVAHIITQYYSLEWAWPILVCTIWHDYLVSNTGRGPLYYTFSLCIIQF